MGLKIASIDAADLFKAVVNEEQMTIIESGLSLKKTIDDKQVWNKYIFKNTLDDSRMTQHFLKVLGDKNMKKEALFKVGGTDATNQIINITFKYTVKGLGKKKKFIMKDGKRVPGSQYEVDAMITAKGGKTDQLRDKLYKDGFDIDGIHYVRWMRSGGSARTGKVLYINEKLLKSMNNYSDCKIKLDGFGKNHDKPAEIDLASFEAYRSLLLSSNIGSIEIKPENILLIDDYESEFEDTVIMTVKNEDNKLETNQVTTKIKNSIWDGQSLIDPSLMGEYSNHGMLLLRNKMFKSCCFNTNIQKWFADNGITNVTQLKRKGGKTKARRVEDIKLITTPSSIKYKKFGNRRTWFEDWLAIADTEYGVVKYEKPTKHDAGQKVLTHYQLINTLQLSQEEVDSLVDLSLEYITELCTDHKAMQRFCKNYCKDNRDSYKIITKMNILTALMDMNSEFHKTAYYGKLAKTVVENIRDGIKKGKIFVNGNYSTLLGNPIEMLQKSIGQFKGVSQLGYGNICSTRFEANKTILACRSPHICMGNIYLPTNTDNELINTYINLTDEIVCINSINENTLQKLSGCDFDSDTALLTDNKILIESAQRNYDNFLVPTSDVEAKKLNEEYIPENLSKLDYRTSINLIGEIVNYSQILNSLYWDKLANGETDLDDIYLDICTLSVMSGIEIDKAKKDFGELNQRKELDKIKNKYHIDAKPQFFDYLSKKNKHRNENQEYKEYKTSMDMLYTSIKDVKFHNIKTKGLPLKSILKNVNYQTAHVNMEMAEALFEACHQRMIANFEMQNMNQEEKIEANTHAHNILIDDVKNIPGIKGIGKSTIRYIFDQLEKENVAIGDYMFVALLNCNCKKVLEILTN